MSKLSTLKLVLGLPLIAAGAAHGEPLVVLPSGHPVAEVRVDGQGPYRFVIDTAASTTNVLPRLVEAIPQSMHRTGAGPVAAASGSTTVELLRLGRFTVAGRTFIDLPAFALPPGPIDKLGVDGVLGADVVSTYALEIDMSGRRWTLTEAPTPASLGGMLPPVPFTLDQQRAPRLTVMLDGRPVFALLDTGARGTIINWAAAEAIGLKPDSPELTAGTPIKGASQHATQSAVKIFETLQIGQAINRAPTIRIADLPVFETVGMAGKPAMILGIDAFAKRRIIIDHPRGQLHVGEEKP